MISSWTVAASAVINVVQARHRNVVHVANHITIAGEVYDYFELSLNVLHIQPTPKHLYIPMTFTAKSVKSNIGNNINKHVPL